MRVETLPQFPKPLPRIIVGTAALGSPLPWPFVSKASVATDMRLLDDMVALGCTAFDTAPVYGLGASERRLGEWMFRRKNRDRIFLITKGAHPSVPFNSSRFNADAITADLDASLKRLRTQTIDLYLLHRDDPSQPVDDVLDTLSRLRDADKIRAYGVSNWSPSRIEAASEFLRRNGMPPLAANSPHFSLLAWQQAPWAGCVSLSGADAATARAQHARSQLPVLAWSPLGRGFFSDRISETTRPALYDFASRWCLRCYGSAENFARRRRARDLAVRRGATAVQIALAYLFSQPFPVFAVIATSSATRMRQNVAATDLRLSAAELRYLETGAEH